MDQVESKFLQTQKFQPHVCFTYIDDIFFHLDSWWKQSQTFYDGINNFNPNIKFTHEFNEASINFLDVNFKLSDGKLQTSLYVKPQITNNTYTFSQVIPNTQKGQQYIVKL